MESTARVEALSKDIQHRVVVTVAQMDELSLWRRVESYRRACLGEC
jgi:hypothetical protein